MNANTRESYNPAQLLADEIAGKYPDARGRFGPFGGRYIPETLVAAFEKLEAAVKQHLHAPDFQAELAAELRNWVGRPTALSRWRIRDFEAGLLPVPADSWQWCSSPRRRSPWDRTAIRPTAFRHRDRRMPWPL